VIFMILRIKSDDFLSINRLIFIMISVRKRMPKCQDFLFALRSTVLNFAVTWKQLRDGCQTGANEKKT
jgi:hypothetical protein